MLDILASEIYRECNIVGIHSVFHVHIRVLFIHRKIINIHKASGTLGRIFQLKRPQDVHR